MASEPSENQGYPSRDCQEHKGLHTLHPLRSRYKSTLISDHRRTSSRSPFMDCGFRLFTYITPFEAQ